jgi:hypothetical protein
MLFQGLYSLQRIARYDAPPPKVRSRDEARLFTLPVEILIIIIRELVKIDKIVQIVSREWKDPYPFYPPKVMEQEREDCEVD